MVVGETGTNRSVGIEPATGSIKKELGRRKWVVFMQLKHPMVETIFVDAIKTKDTEVET